MRKILKSFVILEILAITSFLGISAELEISTASLDKSGVSNARFVTTDKLTSCHYMVCDTCHLPSGAIGQAETSQENSLWNREEPGAAYDVYNSSVGNRGSLHGHSSLCLSCHDGVIARNSHIGSGGTMSIGSGLSSDHPIGIQYPPRKGRNMMDHGYFNPPRGNVKLFQVNGQNQVECASCHDPHGSSHDHSLRVDLSRSQICFSCHDL
jgi:predicted CXXCH cytochrome family protein